MTTWEKAVVPALASFVPRFLVGKITYDGWLERMRYCHLSFGMHDSVMRLAFETWTKQ